MKQSTKPIPRELPTIGKLRWHQLSPFVPVSREKWRTLSRDGKAPPSIRFGVRCTMWDAGEVHRWLADPLNYTAPTNANTTPAVQAA